ncbi:MULTISPECIES: hypothetical protein [unclassified Enterococcus]|uniref:hypothetical protein n=1 Tax=unclassified Enterococcus TaxID=2608891 RepID=UPI003D2B1EB3
MKKFIQKKPHPNEMPIIIVRDSEGNVEKKVSVNEWNKRYRPASLNELEIKLYRQALAYYAEKDYGKAIDLLHFLIIHTEYTRYEYIERLANLYHFQGDLKKELQLIQSALAVAELVGLPQALIKKLEQRKSRL